MKMNKLVFSWLISLTILTTYPYINNKENELQQVQFSDIARQIDYNTTLISQHSMMMQELYMQVKGRQPAVFFKLE